MPWIGFGLGYECVNTLSPSLSLSLSFTQYLILFLSCSGSHSPPSFTKLQTMKVEPLMDWVRVIDVPCPLTLLLLLSYYFTLSFPHSLKRNQCGIKPKINKIEEFRLMMYLFSLIQLDLDVA